MAIIGKIREKSWLILIVIGGALVTFIFTSQGPGGGGPAEEKYGIGTIYGEKVDMEGFNEMIDEEQDNAQRSKDQQLAQQGKQPGSEKAEPVDRDRVWKKYAEELILKKEYEALGIEVSEAEFDAYLFGEEGFTVLPDIANAFQDTATKLFNPKMLSAKIDELETSDNPEDVEQWELSKEYYTELRQKQKYLDILGQGVYVTNLEAKDEYFAKEEKKSISFVVRKYAEVKDDEFPVTDKKLKAYYAKHKGEKIYENKIDAREIRFADLTIEPSEADIKAFNDKVKRLNEEFKTTESDSLFVTKNSEFPYYIPKAVFYPQGHAKVTQQNQMLTYPKNLDTLIKYAEVGEVIGPYDENGSVKMAKVITKSQLLSARHILIGASRADTVAVAKAQKTTDSIMSFINASNFEEYVKEFSTDQGSVEKGGKYEDFTAGEMVPEFSEFATEKPIGEIGYVQTDFGFHIMEVLDRKDETVPSLAILQLTIAPSLETIQNTEDKAYSLHKKLYNKIENAKSDSKKLALFDTLVKKAGTISRPVNIFDNAPKLNEFTSQYAEAEIFKMAFGEESKVGDIISSPIKDGERWIVAIVSAIKVKGESEFNDVRGLVEREYLKQKKYERLAGKLKGKSLETLTESGEVALQNAEVVFANTSIGQFVQDEPEVIGALFGALKDGKLTKPIKGKDGVYVVRIDKTVKPTSTPKDFKTEKDQMVGTIRSGMKVSVTNALVDQADVIDNRRFREIGVRR